MDSTSPTLLRTPWQFSPSVHQRLAQSNTSPSEWTCELTQQDEEYTFAHDLFNLSKPNNRTIRSVHCIYDMTASWNFALFIQSQEEIAKRPTFAQQWRSCYDSETSSRFKAIKAWEECVKKWPVFIQWAGQHKVTYNRTHVLPLWDKEPSCTTGSQNTSNDCLFGKGKYFATSAGYAASTCSNGKLFLSWVSMREPYPVVADRICTPPDEPSDVKIFKTLTGAYLNYNAHYIRIIPTDPSNEHSLHYPCTINQNPACSLFVVFKNTQILPALCVQLEPTMYTSPALPSPQAQSNEAPNEAPNEAKAQYELGLHYWSGKEVEKDLSKAFLLFEKAAAQGLPTAQFSLGICYASGAGTKKSLPKAILCYTQAAKQGHMRAQYNLGISYLNGTGLGTNHAYAFYWFEKAAIQGFAMAQYNLGVCYLNGIGIDKKPYLAFTWFLKAANQDYGKAQYHLGLCYWEGTEITKNLNLATYWFLKAANKGVSEAQEILHELPSEIVSQVQRITTQGPQKTS